LTSGCCQSRCCRSRRRRRWNVGNKISPDRIIFTRRIFFSFSVTLFLSTVFLDFFQKLSLNFLAGTTTSVSNARFDTIEIASPFWAVPCFSRPGGRGRGREGGRTTRERGGAASGWPRKRERASAPLFSRLLACTNLLRYLLLCMNVCFGRC
jgi:hypothetical protein